MLFPLMLIKLMFISLSIAIIQLLIWITDCFAETIIVGNLNVSVIRPNYLGYYIFWNNDLGKGKSIHILWLIKNPSLLFRDSWDYWNNVIQANNTLGSQTWDRQLQITFPSLSSPLADLHAPAGGKLSSFVGITFTQSAHRLRWRSLGSSLEAGY